MALAVDLYRGKVTSKQEDAHQLMMGLPPDRAIARPEGGVRAPGGARRREEGPHRRRSAGAWAASTRWPLATRGARAGGGGGLLRRAADRRRGHREDQGARARQLRRRRQGPLAGAGQGVRGGHEEGRQERDIKIYEGAGHAFANANNPWSGYREAAAKDAWARTTAFFGQAPEEVAPARQATAAAAGARRERRGLGRGKQSRRKLQRRHTRGRSIIGKSSRRARLASGSSSSDFMLPALFSMKRRACSSLRASTRAPHVARDRQVGELGPELSGVLHPALLGRVERVARELDLVEAALGPAGLPVHDHHPAVPVAEREVHAQEDLVVAHVERDQVLDGQPALPARRRRPRAASRS